MLNLKRILQLRLNGESKLQISLKVPIHRNVLDKYLCLFEQSGQSYESLLQLSDHELQKVVHPPQEASPDGRLSCLQGLLPGFAAELSSPGVTLRQLWQEYLSKHPDGYRYAQFCTYFAQYKERFSATMHFDHVAGDMLEVDFAGSKLSFVDMSSGRIHYCPVLVCTLTYSGYAYVEALADATQGELFRALNRCLFYFGAVPRNVKSDNMRQFVSKNSRYEFSFPELAQQWSLHYNTSLAATRPRKPKDKPTVENTVHLSYLRIFAPLRKQQFHSLESLNNAMLPLLDAHNNAPFQKKPGSRSELFSLHEKPQMAALPQCPFEAKHTATAKVQKNYHVILGEDNHQYSVPYIHIGKQAKLVYDHCEVEVFIGMDRIAIHRRTPRKLGYTTLKEHMPIHHQQQSEARGWDAEFFLRYAQSIGESTYGFISKLIGGRTFPEQTYKACLGVKRLGTSYGAERLESACHRALLGQISYGSLKHILEQGLDLLPLPDQEALMPEIEHENIRGAEAYR